LSKNAKDILQNLLNKDPSKRPTMAQLKKDPYFEGIDWEKLAHKKYRPPIKLGKPDKTSSGKKEDLASIFHESITSSSAG
jgi:serine/threonine protein kinase